VEYLDLADELGMYVVDETGVEAHATEYLSEDPAWREAYVNRGRRMVLRDRNHPCIILWSAGNESGSGENIAAVIREGKRLDPSRPAWCYGGNTDLLPFEDVVGPRYPDLHELAAVAAVPESVDPRPSFMDEYLAATGNSLGNLDEYWDLIWKNPRLTGGAVWDWISPGVLDSARFTPDASPRANAGVLLGRSRLVPGRFGNAVSLSGHDDWVEAYNDEALDPGPRGLTVEAWVFPRRWNGYGGFAAKGDAYGLEQKDWGTLAFYIRDGVRVEAAAPVPDEWEYRWHHLAGTYDGEKLVLYVDGKSVSAAPHQGAVDRSPHALAVGRSMHIVGMERPGELSNAVIDAVAVFPRALGPEEIGGMSAALRAESVLWWDFDEWSPGPRYYSLGIGARAYGLVWPDRTPQPELWQLKKSPQPVRFEMMDAGAGRVRVTNRHAFTDLAEFETVWRVESEGRVLESGVLDLRVPPQASEVLEVPFSRPVPPAPPGAETRLLLSVRLARDLAWAQAGHEVAWEEFVIGGPADPVPVKPGAAPALAETEYAFRVTAGEVEARVDRKTGTLSSLKHRGRERLVSGPVFSAWRAPLSNETERDWGGAPIADAWREAGLDRLRTTVRSASAETLSDRVRVTVRSEASSADGPAGFSCAWRYDFLGTGDVIVDVKAEPFGPMPPWLPKMGLALTVSDSLREFTWYGRGPFETYPDRKTGAKTGLYSGTVDDQFTPYLVPQDYGNKTDVRWAALTDASGSGLFVSGDSLFNASVHHYGTDHLTRALYPFRLRAQDGVTLNLDPWVCGVGETPIKTQPEHRVVPREVRFRFRLAPFAGGRGAALDLARTSVFE
jgi:beta-galactosidase